MCALYNKILTTNSLFSVKLRRFLETKHADYIEKGIHFFKTPSDWVGRYKSENDYLKFCAMKWVVNIVNYSVFTSNNLTQNFIEFLTNLD